MAKIKKESSWKWYAVKLLFESTISGEANKEKIDENFSNEYKMFEEQIVIIRAQSFDHAYKKAEVVATKGEMIYNNPYDQTVCCKFIDSLDCFCLFDNQIKSETEVYSRLIKVPVWTKTKEFVTRFFPETSPSDGEITPFYNFLINE